MVDLGFFRLNDLNTSSWLILLNGQIVGGV